MKRELMQQIRGIIPPLVTPLTDQGQIDADGLERLIEHQIVGGVHGLFILGTTGEGPSLAYDKRRELISRVCRLVDSRVPVLVGITDTSLAESVALASFAADAGCDALVAAPPGYYPLQQRDLLAYFQQLIQDLPLPLMLYNMPAVAHSTIELETVRRLLDQSSIVGLKDSSGDLDYFRSLLAITSNRPDFSLMVGPERLLSTTLALGGSGGVSGGANIWPRLFVGLYNAAIGNNRIAVSRLAETLMRLGQIYTVGPTSIPATVARIKSALSICQMCNDTTAPPIAEVSQAERERIEIILNELGLASRHSKVEISNLLPS